MVSAEFLKINLRLFIILFKSCTSKMNTFILSHKNDMIYSLDTSFHTQKKSYKMAFQLLNHFYEKEQVKHIIILI